MEFVTIFIYFVVYIPLNELVKTNNLEKVDHSNSQRLINKFYSLSKYTNRKTLKLNYISFWYDIRWDMTMCS